jgi:hypothetical protein
MTFRKNVLCTAFVFGLMPSLGASAAPTCDGAECPPAPRKPLNIMQFMREQAASTRVGEVQHRKSRPASKAKSSAAKAQRSAHSTIAATPKPATLPAEAATSFASQPRSDVQVVGSGELNPADVAAVPAPAETAATPGQDVQLVDAAEFNDIDRKAVDSATAVTEPARAQPAEHADQTHVSWLRRIWSALGYTFAALATAAHRLIGLA